LGGVGEGGGRGGGGRGGGDIGGGEGGFGGGLGGAYDGACVPQLLVVCPLLVSKRVIHLLFPVAAPTWMPTMGAPVRVTSWPVTKVPHE